MKRIFISVLAVLLGRARFSLAAEAAGRLPRGNCRAIFRSQRGLRPLSAGCQVGRRIQKMHPGVRIDISAGGAGKGMTDALAQVGDLGMVSRDVYPPEEEKGAVGFAVAKMRS